MFKQFFEETKWLLIIVTTVIIILLGNVAYFVWEDGKLDRENEGIPEWLWNPEVRELDVVLKGLEFKQLKENLYSLTGTVRQDDCEKIVPLLPIDKPFSVILESPGGSLFDGGCIAAHFKLRDVITVVRDTPVLDEDGNILYQPGLIPMADKNDEGEGYTICASSCSLIFLGGDLRYLIGNVFLGIHAPHTPEEVINTIGKRALESDAYRTAASLQLLLEKLGVTDPNLRLLFIQVPAASMYWLTPRDFESQPTLITLATHYKNFWGFNFENEFMDVIDSNEDRKIIMESEPPPTKPGLK